MKSFMKKMLAVLLAVSLLMPMNVFAAVSSPSKNSAERFEATIKSRTYNGKYQKAVLRIKTASGRVLTEGKHFKVVSKKTSFKNAGKYIITIKGIGKFTGTKKIAYRIKKADQKIAVTGAKTSLKASALRKRSQTFRLKTEVKGGAKVTYKASSKRIKINQSTGKVVLKRGMKKGRYKIVVSTDATKNYEAGKKTIYIRVK